MGHYASEMDPNWGRSIERTDRKLRLRDKVDQTPLSKFKGRHFPALMELYSYDDLLPENEKLLKEVVGD
jgi:hypothetical protein